jgi:hypothetical protein
MGILEFGLDHRFILEGEPGQYRRHGRSCLEHLYGAKGSEEIPPSVRDARKAAQGAPSPSCQHLRRSVASSR